MKMWPIAIAVVSTVLLIGCAAETQPGPVHEDPARSGPASAHQGVLRAGPAPVRIGVVLNALDNPFWLAIYEGAETEAVQRGVPANIRAVTSNADLAGQAAQLRALVAAREDCYAVGPITATDLVTALRGVTRPVVVINSPIDPAAAKRAGVHPRTYRDGRFRGRPDGRRPDGRAAACRRRGGPPRRLGR